MNNTLFTNDVILVNKLKNGPKSPRFSFDIPWLNIAFSLNENVKKRIKELRWPYKRLYGTSFIKNGDVVVFTMFRSNMVIVKRCMGIAGDTISIRKGEAYINNKIFSPSMLVLNNYEFEVNDLKAFYRKLDSINLNVSFSRTTANHFKTSLSFKDKIELEELGIVYNLIKVTDSFASKSTAYPNSEYNQWNLDNYGPYIIPEKGMTIHLTKKNHALYHKVIKEHEGVEIKNIESGYTINEKRVRTYTFKQDYYFMMGDNRKGSMDSRYWGVVPEERIIGKVLCVLWSNYQDGFQWERFFKSVN